MFALPRAVVTSRCRSAHSTSVWTEGFASSAPVAITNDCQGQPGETGDRVWYAVVMTSADTPYLSPLETCATQPMGRALRLLGDVPTLLIIATLLRGTRRFGELGAAVAECSPKTIAQRLRLLETQGFVHRQAFAEIPPRVEYTLTEKGLALADVVSAIREFGERYLADEQGVEPCEEAPTG